MKNTKKYILLYLLILANSLSLAQSARIFKNRLGISIGTGIATYSGDYTAQLGDFVPKPSISLGGTYRLTKNISARADFGAFQLTGSQKTNYANTHFLSNHIEASAGFTYDLYKMRKAFAHRNSFNPYFTIGLGFTAFDSKISKFEKRTLSSELEVSDYALIVPVGIGVRIKASKYLDVVIEASYRKTFSDKIDNSHLNSDFLTFQEMTNLKGDRQNSNSSEDGYLITQVKLQFSPAKFSKKKAKSIQGISDEVLKLMKEKSLAISSR